MIKVQLFTTWMSENVYDLERLLQIGDSVMDISGTPTESVMSTPNMLFVEAWISRKTYLRILNDREYGIGAIFFSQEMN